MEGAAVLQNQLKISDDLLLHRGAAFRHERTWLQVRTVVRTLRPGRTLTTHALETGFYDSSHLSSSFRKLFGLSPRALLRASVQAHRESTR